MLTQELFAMFGLLLALGALLALTMVPRIHDRLFPPDPHPGPQLAYIRVRIDRRER